MVVGPSAYEPYPGSDQRDRAAKRLVVPAKCHRGHSLEPRTTMLRTEVDFKTKKAQVQGFDCAVCLRVACWRAHTSNPIPDELLDPAAFIRPAKQLARFVDNVSFEGGIQYADPDPTCRKRRRRRQVVPASLEPGAIDHASVLDDPGPAGGYLRSRRRTAMMVRVGGNSGIPMAATNVTP